MYVTSKQVDEAAEIIRKHVPSADIDDCVRAVCEIQETWGLGFLSPDPMLNEKPRRDKLTGNN
jgi:hypothetical protein